MPHGHRGRSPGASDRSSGSRGRGASASSHHAQTSLVVDDNLPATTPPGPPTVDGPELEVHHRSARHPSAPPVPKRRRGRPPNVRSDTPSPDGGAAGSSPPADAPCPPALHTPDATEPGSSRSTPPATLRRGPGRPRKQTNTSATPVRICPTTGDKVDDLLDSGIGAQHDFSLTISARNSGNVESHVFEDVDKYLQERMVRGIVSLERGNVHGNLHLQGIFTAGLVKHFDDPRTEEAAMRKSIRQACEWKSHVTVKIVTKRLMRQQTFSGMLGYCSKDQGRPHSEDRVELGKKNSWDLLRRFKQEHLRGISVSPLQMVTWIIQDQQAVPSSTWICLSSAFPMDAARADAFAIALFCPSLFIRKHAYLMFFAGGQGGRITTSHEDWDMQDREFADMTVDQAKFCSHDRLELEGAMDTARERAVREVANARRHLPGVPNFGTATAISSGVGWRPHKQRLLRSERGSTAHRQPEVHRTRVYERRELVPDLLRTLPW
ncbi:unnamed protein product [Ectocarpus sp. 13 AM-2016]